MIRLILAISNFSVRRYFPLIRKDSVIHMHSLSVYVKDGLSFARNLSLQNSQVSYLYFRLSLLHLVSYCLFLCRSPSLCTINFQSIFFVSISPSANAFFFGNFDVHHNDWLTYSDGTDRPGELCYNFSQMTLLRQLTFLHGSLTMTLTEPAPLDLSLSSDASISSIVTFRPLGNSNHVVVSVAIDFLSSSKWDAPFRGTAYDYPRADLDGLCDHLRDVPWENIFKFGTIFTAR